MNDILVIKFGTAVLTKNGEIQEDTIAKIASEVKQLSKKYTILLVSSGTVACGKQAIANYKGTMVQRKAAAAIGNPTLLHLYQHQFKKQKLHIAQALCERHHFSNRHSFAQLQHIFSVFWENNIIPILNENDLISNNEVSFSDNDELATMLAIGLSAKKLMMCTSAGGLLNFEGKPVADVKKIDQSVWQYVQSEKTDVGLGGMKSKLNYAQLATSLGIEVYITGLQSDAPLRNTINRKQGTFFFAQKSTLKQRQKWLRTSVETKGGIQVDAGAEKALRKRKSLLTVGVVNVIDTFLSAQVVMLYSLNNEPIGVAKVKLSAVDIAKNLTTKNCMAAHTDDIVLF